MPFEKGNKLGSISGYKCVKHVKIGLRKDAEQLVDDMLTYFTDELTEKALNHILKDGNYSLFIASKIKLMEVKHQINKDLYNRELDKVKYALEGLDDSASKRNINVRLDAPKNEE